MVASDLVYDGMVWDVRSDTVRYGNGEIVRQYIDHPGASAIVAVDEDDRVLLIQQYRHPIRHRDWEIPAGLLDVPGESPLETARRELAEEVDLVASRWNVLVDMLPTPGGSNETIRVYLARDVTAVPAFERSDEEADIETRWVPLDDVVDAVLARAVQSPSLVVGALAAAAARARDWATLAPGDEPWLRHPVVGGAPWHTR